MALHFLQLNLEAYKPMMSALVASVTAHKLPPLAVLAKVVGWVIFIMNWHAKSRVLTTTEVRIRAAAWRLADSIHGPQSH